MILLILLVVSSLGGGSNAQAFESYERTSEIDTSLNIDDAEERKFSMLINDFRKENGLAPLQVSKRLTVVAKWMASDMAEKNYISHTDSLGRDPYQRMASLGYTGWTASGENLCAGTVTSTAERALQQWKDSPGHRENMLSPHYRFMGIARAYGADSEYGWYWANEFGSLD